MKISSELKENIQNKKIELDNLKEYLKTEFVGIDNIIENVIDSMTPFYLFPETLQRPITINLWGMTGVGKSSLVKKIVEFLKLNKSYLTYDLGEYNNSSDDKLRKDLASKINRLNSESNIIVFDEFQLGRTIDETGMEIDKSTLRPIWDLLDHGIIYTYNLGIQEGLIELIEKINKSFYLDIQVDDNGWVIKNEAMYESLFSGYSKRPCDYKESRMVTIEDGKETIEILDPSSEEPYYGEGVFKKPRFFKKDMFDHYIYDANPDFFDNLKMFDYHKKLFYTSLSSLIKFIEKDFFDTVSILEKKDYSKSLIFCLGNLDEVYHMSHNINPDEDADSFHEHTLKITMPQIKQALSTRFRMEQIGRLGNTHFIYPSLSKKSYEKLIEMYLTKQKNYLMDDFEINVNFDKSVYDILYKEGVYPTQGTRPLLSTFNSMINSPTSNLLTELSLKMVNVDNIEWKYNDCIYYITATSNSKKGKNKTLKLEYPVEIVLEKLRKTDNSETQTLVAIHEAGHAIMSCIKREIAPVEILSKTADLSEGYCRFEYNGIIESKKFIYETIMVYLGGIVAEELIFGKDNVTVGSSSDLRAATDSAVQLIKRNGMDKHVGLISASSDEIGNKMFIKSKKMENKVLKLLKKAKKETMECLKENKKYLIILGKILSQKNKVETDELKDILKDLNINWKDCSSYHNFKKILSEY